MGLGERRKIKDLADTVLPKREKGLLEITGSPIRYAVDWESLAIDAKGLNFLDNLSCHRLNMAPRVICADDPSKEAVRDGLKLVKLANMATPAQMKISSEGGVLEMHCSYEKLTDGIFSDNPICHVLMAKL